MNINKTMRNKNTLVVCASIHAEDTPNKTNVWERTKSADQKTFEADACPVRNKLLLTKMV